MRPLNFYDRMARRNVTTISAAKTVLDVIPEIFAVNAKDEASP